MEKINLIEIANNSRELNVQELRDLLAYDRTVFWSWGCQNFVNYGNKILKFKVNGHHHKGNVFISLNGNDLFDIVLTSSQNNIKDKLNDIYFDDLVNVLDTKIEKIKEYVR